MHDLPHLPHYIASPMHQCMFIIFKQSRTPINQQRDETKQNKIKERDKDSRIHKIGQIGAKTCGKKHTHTHTTTTTTTTTTYRKRNRVSRRQSRKHIKFGRQKQNNLLSNSCRFIMRYPLKIANSSI